MVDRLVGGRIMKQKTKTALKAVYITVGTVLLINGLTATLLSNMNAGVLATYIIGAAALIYGVLLDKMLKAPIAVNALCMTLVAFGFSFCIALLLYGRADTVNYNEDAVVVLGAGIKGEKVGNCLKHRLDGAVEYHHKNPKALIVVSGGQGQYEDISEALAMERYLIAQGVPQQLIIKEDRSTSTKENFLFSKQLLDERFEGEEYRVAFISNAFHIYRAELTAERAGLEDAAHIGTTTPYYLVIPSTFRECMAVVKYWTS